MRLKNEQTGSVVDMPLPDALGQSFVRVNGKIVAHVLYSDDNGGSVTLGDGTKFSPEDWVEYVVKKLASKEWS